MTYFDVWIGFDEFGRLNTHIIKDWNGAETFCESANMRLASIESSAQRDLLYSKYDNTTYHGGKFFSYFPALITKNDNTPIVELLIIFAKDTALLELTQETIIK